MSKSGDQKKPQWLESLGSRAKTELTVWRSLSTLPSDPFKAREAVSRSKIALQRDGCDVPEQIDELLKDIEGRCVVAEAEFWDAFSAGCADRGWQLEGTTARRFLCRGIPMHLQAGTVSVDELGLSFTPIAGEVLLALEPYVLELVPSDFNPRGFLDLLAAAYDQIPTAGASVEKPIEAVYRTVVVMSQKPVFWKTLSTARFIRLSRPSFRARIAAILETNIVPTDGRAVRFGTTVIPSQAWEIYSPGEGHFVQVGRIAFVQRGDPDDNQRDR